MKLLKFVKKSVKRLVKRFGFEIVPILPPPKVPRTILWLRQFTYFARLFELIKNTPGDIVECGSGTGRTFLMLAYNISSEKSPHSVSRKLWGFDSFQGFPEPSKEDIPPRGPEKGEWSHASMDEVRRRLVVSGVIPNNFIEERVEIVQGFFNETLKNFPERPIALLHIDADLYQSYKDALTILFPKVAGGVVVTFDEYGSRKWPGATQAVDEYFRNTKYRVERDELSQKYFVIKK